ncbi:hypothetical protein ACCO45_004511 [Purpureocillium lilacinum]|uniref:Uncharacterized protein n=1 Tax=Purpureocillium lilacinum TaxID=33203 RepID=A0ACC4E427_PURLI
MKKAYELNKLTGSEVLLLVTSESGLVYTFASPKLRPIVASGTAKKLVQDSLRSVDNPSSSDGKIAAGDATDHNSFPDLHGNTILEAEDF